MGSKGGGRRMWVAWHTLYGLLTFTSYCQINTSSIVSIRRGWLFAGTPLGKLCLQLLILLGNKQLRLLG